MPNLRDEHGYNLHHTKLYPLLGLKVGHHLPVEGSDTSIWIDNVEVWIDPKIDKRRRHRVMCRCPHCGWVGSAGRLHQHQGNPRNGVWRPTKTCKEHAQRRSRHAD